ncbi:hypothetical protein LBMAG48_25630 [Phycisphaerae bacterium]|nr:hypothetical protein LBMAG48_25630 [Phycisphaerae bacterium]
MNLHQVASAIHHVCSAKALIASIVLATTAASSVAGEYSKVAFNDAGWTIVATHANSPTNEVTSILLGAQEQTTSGDNLRLIWYRRDTDTNDWSSWSWKSTDLDAARKYIEQEENLPLDARIWRMLGLQSQAAATAIAPLPYDKGLLADDPLNLAIGSLSDRDLVVQLLVDSGYEAATVPFEKAESAACNAGSKLSALAIGFEAAFAQPTELAPYVASTSYSQQDPNCLPTSGSGPNVVGVVTGPVGPASPWGITSCVTNPNGTITCKYQRSQNHLRRRVRKVNGVYICEYRIETCIQYEECTSPVPAPATPTCMPPFELLPDLYPGLRSVECPGESWLDIGTNPWIQGTC